MAEPIHIARISRVFCLVILCAGAWAVLLVPNLPVLRAWAGAISVLPSTPAEAATRAGDLHRAFLQFGYYLPLEDIVTEDPADRQACGLGEGDALGAWLPLRYQLPVIGLLRVVEICVKLG